MKPDDVRRQIARDRRKRRIAYMKTRRPDSIRMRFLELNDAIASSFDAIACALRPVIDAARRIELDQQEAA